MPILSFILNRVIQAGFVLIAVTLFVSFAIRLTGDPAVMMLRESANVTPEDLARIREGLGLNRPFLVQYGDFIGGLLTGDLGNSFFRGAIAPLVSGALGATLLLALTSLAVSLLISVPLGIYAATHRGSFGDQLVRVLSLAGLFTGIALGLTPGTTIVVATLTASASYIAAPVAVRHAIEDADIGLVMLASLGITFPFNVLIGIELYASLLALLG